MTEFIVIGAGVYGSATAWWLAQKGAGVVVLDEREVGTRASGGPGRRGVRANGRDLRELALMPEVYELWPELHQRLEAAPFYERTGQLLLAETEFDQEAALARRWMQQRQGVATEWLDAGAVREREPGLSDAIRGALYCPNDGVANHAAATQAFAAAAKSLGAIVRTQCHVESIEVTGGRAVAVRTAQGERLSATRGVFVLGNSTVAGLVAPWLTLPVWNECLQVLVSAPMGVVPFKHLTGHLSRTVSLKPEGANRVMVSGGWHGRWDQARQTGEALDHAIQGNVNQAAAVYPGLADLRIEVADAQSPGIQVHRPNSYHRSRTGDVQSVVCHRLVRAWLGHCAASDSIGRRLGA